MNEGMIFRGVAAGIGAGGLATAEGEPPPSTMAAQLVENISSPTKSYRPDENIERKKLQAVIQRVVKDPSLLKTLEDRVAHNHLLIYVLSLVRLHDIRLDDPFLDKTDLRKKLNSTLNFLRFTINETPTVLNHSTNGEGFLHRGREPLWVWLLPQLLQLLGNDNCLELQTMVEGFLHYLQLTTLRQTVMWGFSNSFRQYLRSILTALLDQLQVESPNANGRQSLTVLYLPPSASLDLIVPDIRDHTSPIAWYRLSNPTQMIRQAASICKILSESLTSSDSGLAGKISLADDLTWILDAWLDLLHVQKRWDEEQLQSSRISLLTSVIEMLHRFTAEPDLNVHLREKTLVLLAMCCSDVATHPKDLVQHGDAGRGARQTFCKALIVLMDGSRHFEAVRRMAISQLVDELTALCARYDSLVDSDGISLQSRYSVIGLGTDVWKCMRLLHLCLGISQDSHDSEPDTDFTDTSVGRFLIELDIHFGPNTEPDAAGASKRRKTSALEPLLRSPLSLLSRILSIPMEKSSDISQLEPKLLSALHSLDEGAQCRALDLLSRLSCESQKGQPSSNAMLSLTDCTLCGLDPTVAPMKPEEPCAATVRVIFTRIIQSPQFAESKKPRVVLMVALRRLANHCIDPDFLDLEKPGAGQWCLQSLNSSLRELRVAAGRTLVCFLVRRSASVDSDLILQNRKNAIGILKSVSEKDCPHLRETCILAWGQLGRVVDENELNLVLIQLCDYLGSSNNLISAFAFNELLNLAKARNTTPEDLFKPYWRNLAYLATKDMLQRPQLSRAIAELLQVDVSELLIKIQSHALPWLVLDKRMDTIQKIAEARGETEIWRPVLDGANMVGVLTLLLVQEEPKTALEFAQARLEEISQHFSGLTIVDWFQSEPLQIAVELLKLTGEADGSRKTLIRGVIQRMATMVSTANNEPKQKKSNATARFLQAYLLGIMAVFTDVIHDNTANQFAALEQRRCMKALAELIQLCGSYASIARPQISACLLAAIAQEKIRQLAFECWFTMIRYLGPGDVEALLETTFYIVPKYWEVSSATTRQVILDMLSFICTQHADVLARNVSKIPSLSHIEGLKDINTRLEEMRPVLAFDEELSVFCERIQIENPGVVSQALSELVPYLRHNQVTLVANAATWRSESVVTRLLRILLDCACTFHGTPSDIGRQCTEAIGLIGCVDSNHVETVREQREIVVIDNFDSVDETTDFALFLIEVVVVPSFLSTTDVKLQGFLSYAMQELLERCEIRSACAMHGTGMLEGQKNYRKWLELPVTVQEVLTPFLTSRYLVAQMEPVSVEYPIFQTGRSYVNWLRFFVIDMLRKGQNPYADMIFEPLTRVIRLKDLSTAEFLLPYLVLHVLLGERSTQQEKDNILGELSSILRYRPRDDAHYHVKEDARRFYFSVFRVLDYAMRWVQAKKTRGKMSNAQKMVVAEIQKTMESIPAELVSQRAVDCNEFARALFYLEQHAQKPEPQKGQPGDRTKMLERLQDIYANIDEPDGLDGVSAHLHVLDVNQQVLSHKKAGRWTSAQTWYEMELAQKPGNVEIQLELLNCLKQAGQHDVLLNHVEGMLSNSNGDSKIMPFAVEAAWVTGRWESLSKFMSRSNDNAMQDFNMSIARLFETLRTRPSHSRISSTISEIRDTIASAMNHSATTSLQTAHDLMLKCHVLTDLELIAKHSSSSDQNQRHEEHQEVMSLLEGRLGTIGTYFNDKQYLLGIRRAAMELMRPTFSDTDISGLWLTTAKIARKSGSLTQSFSASLHASRLGDDAATIETAKLLWKDNQTRKAIQMLQGAIERNKFMTQASATSSIAASEAAFSTISTTGARLTSQQKLLTARAQLLLAKWLDASGHLNATALREKFQQPPRTHVTWEKGHFYLGHHYKKILESEKPLKVDDQSDVYITGEIARLVIENYVRSLNAGTKYLYQTLPRVLTLWLEMGANVNKPPEGKPSLSRELAKRRIEQLTRLHTFLDKYIQRLPAYVFYTSLPQIVARLAHQNEGVYDRLRLIIVKVIEAHPRQALWSIIGVMTTKVDSARRKRGQQILGFLKQITKKVDGTAFDLKQMLRAAERLADQLLAVCTNGDFQGNRTVTASLTKDLRFSHKCTPCPLAVPVESALTATLPAVTEQLKKHKAFSRDVVTIECFLDEVLVLSSLAKPRRLTARGSDGKTYMLLIKPKDDLRTDQRLMEFNGIINRSLKRDAESSRRQLYIRTYAVVPLNEECGIIEWVPGIRTIRDILLNLYASRKIHPDYQLLKQLMDEACKDSNKIGTFTEDVLGRFPSVMQLWFVHRFPNPSAWFAARLRYTRSCAVMSMVGTILGLGDRHGENVNLEEGNGGVFHVDFNCLFDKGLTFAKPERVPFRLTHNMVAAMGIYGYEGPFRKSSELTLTILRQQEETLMTILEAFIYDPTLDLQREKSSKKRGDAGVTLQPQNVVDSIKRKVRGLLGQETLPLSVEGQVEELIKQAVSPYNLTAMYIGWCPFL